MVRFLGGPLRVLVPGHNGCLGFVPTPRLEHADHDLVGLDSAQFPACTFGPPEVELEASLQRDPCDIENDPLVRLDAVIHLAAVCNDPIGDLTPQPTYDIEHLAPVRTAERTQEAGMRSLFLSGSGLYGKAGEDMLDESATVAPGLSRPALCRRWPDEPVDRLDREMAV
jgi:nucleoside-diphosphate-sugar epimerase